jgi:hypothetical protein
MTILVDIKIKDTAQSPEIRPFVDTSSKRRLSADG